MKKKVSRSVVKAMAIGISAFAAASATSVTALANDGEENNEILDEDSKDAVEVATETKDEA